MRWVLVCALLLCGCHKTPPRILHIQVAVGPDLRQQADWRDRVAGRIRAASAIFRPLNLQFEMAGASEWAPDPKLPPEMNRWMLGGFHTSGDWIALGLYGSAQPGAEPGLAVPFDARVLVYDIPGGNEERNAAAMAHELAHVLGAWHPPQSGSLMSLPPGSRVDDTALSCLRLTRALDLRQGAAGLDAETVTRLQKLWTASKADPSTNPFYRFYSSVGAEAYRRGVRPEAEEDFIKAASFGPDVARAHLDLANAEMTNREYLEAVDEYRKASKLDPRSSAAISGLAAALLGSGQRQEAVQALSKGLQMNPGDAAAHANMGVVLVGTPGRLDDGIAELREALRISPNSEQIKRSLDAALEARSKGRK